MGYTLEFQYMYRSCLFSSAVIKFAKKLILALSFLSVRPSAWDNSVFTGEGVFSFNFTFDYFSKTLRAL